MLRKDEKPPEETTPAAKTAQLEPDIVSEERNMVLSYRNTVNEAYDHALFVYKGNPPKPIVEYKKKLDQDFEDLLGRVEDMKSLEDYEHIDERALELLNNRAFLYPDKELGAEVQAKYEEVLSWGVSAEQSASIKRALDLIRDRKTSDARKRAYLLKVYEDYDALDDYVDWINPRLYKTGIFLLATTILGLAGSILLMTVFGQLIPAIIVAGASGAALSILTKLPPQPTKYGDWHKFLLKGLSRFGTGLLASLVGYGLFAANIVNLNIGLGSDAKSLSDVLKNAADGQAGALNTMIVVSIGIVFGFTERLISRIGSTFVPEKEPSAKKSE